MYKYTTKTFIFKNQMVDYIAEYYSSIAQGLTDAEYQELENIYYSTKDITEGLDKELFTEFKDFDIYRCKNGDWEIKRIS